MWWREKGTYPNFSRRWFEKAKTSGQKNPCRDTEKRASVSKEVLLSHDAAVQPTLVGMVSRGFESPLLRSIVVASPATTELDPESIPKEWILSGAPVARGKVLARSRDLTSSTVVW